MSGHAVEHHAAPSGGAEGGSELLNKALEAPLNAVNRLRNGFKEAILGILELPKIVVNPFSAHPWENSALEPIANALKSIAIRPITTVEQLFKHGDHWGFYPGQAWNEVVAMAEAVLQTPIEFLDKIGNRLSVSSHRIIGGAAEILRSVGATPPSDRAVSSVQSTWNLPQTGLAGYSGHGGGHAAGQ